MGCEGDGEGVKERGHVECSVIGQDEIGICSLHYPSLSLPPGKTQEAKHTKRELLRSVIMNCV